MDSDEEQERLKTLEDEILPGTCKSQYALKFRLISDQNNANFMKDVSKNFVLSKSNDSYIHMNFNQINQNSANKRTKTKGRFPTNFQTNAGVWMRDRDWKETANPALRSMGQRMELMDIKMLEKRKK